MHALVHSHKVPFFHNCSQTDLLPPLTLLVLSPSPIHLPSHQKWEPEWVITDNISLPTSCSSITSCCLHPNTKSSYYIIKYIITSVPTSLSIILHILLKLTHLNCFSFPQKKSQNLFQQYDLVPPNVMRIIESINQTPQPYAPNTKLKENDITSYSKLEREWHIWHLTPINIEEAI